MRIKIFFFGCISFCGGLVFSLHTMQQQYSVEKIQKCWQLGYYTKKKDKICFMRDGEEIAEKYPWGGVVLDSTGEYAMVWCNIHDYLSSSQCFSVENLQLQQASNFFSRCFITPHRTVHVSDTAVELARGYKCINLIDSCQEVGEGVLQKGKYPVYGEFTCIPACVRNQTQHLYLFLIYPFTYVTDLGSYDKDDTIFHAMNHAGSMVVVVSKNASIQIFKVQPDLHMPRMLQHAKMRPLHNIFFNFA
jgi:hypothetical protein